MNNAAAHYLYYLPKEQHDQFPHDFKGILNNYEES